MGDPHPRHPHRPRLSRGRQLREHDHDQGEPEEARQAGSAAGEKVFVRLGLEAGNLDAMVGIIGEKESGGGSMYGGREQKRYVGCFNVIFSSQKNERV